MADPDDLVAHISGARVLSEQVTSFRALLAALDEARGFPDDIDESKAIHTHQTFRVTLSERWSTSTGSKTPAPMRSATSGKRRTA